MFYMIAASISLPPVHSTAPRVVRPGLKPSTLANSPDKTSPCPSHSQEVSHLSLLPDGENLRPIHCMCHASNATSTRNRVHRFIVPVAYCLPHSPCMRRMQQASASLTISQHSLSLLTPRVHTASNLGARITCQSCPLLRSRTDLSTTTRNAMI